MIVDIYTHIFPDRFFQELERGSPKLGNMGKRLRGVRKLFDLDAALLATWTRSATTAQIISLPNPPIEDIAEGAVANNLASVANDSMAELCAKHPDRFPAFAAAVSMHDVDSRSREADARHQDGRARRADLHQHRRPSARRAALPAVLRRDGRARPADLAASGAHLGDAGLCGRAALALRDVVVLRLALRDHGRDVPAGVRRHLRPPSEAEDHHPPSRRRHDPVLRRPHRCRHGGARPRTVDEDHTKVLSLAQAAALDYFKEFYADTAMFGGTTGCRAASSSSAPTRWCSRPTRRSRRSRCTSRRSTASISTRPTYKKIMRGNAEKLLNMKFG